MKYIKSFILFLLILGFIGTGTYVFAISPLVNTNGYKFGIGTTTPFSTVQIASSTASATFKAQLVLTDMAVGVNQKHWYISSDKGSFNIGTTSDTYATSSPRIKIAISGNIGLGTSTPGTTLDVNGDITDEKAIPRVNTGANTAIACYTTGGQLGYITVTNLLGVTPACSAL